MEQSAEHPSMYVPSWSSVSFLIAPMLPRLQQLSPCGSLQQTVSVNHCHNGLPEFPYKVHAGAKRTIPCQITTGNRLLLAVPSLCFDAMASEGSRAALVATITAAKHTAIAHNREVCMLLT